MLKPLTLSLMLIANVAVAGPDATTNRLMDSSPSMLDWGIFRMEARLLGDKGIDPAPLVEYIWKDNVILISGNVMLGNWKLEAAQSHCKDWFNSVRIGGGVHPDKGEVFGGAAVSNSWFSDLFTHNGYSQEVGGKTLVDLRQDIDNKIRLDFRTRYTKEDGEQGQLICSGSLLSNSVSYETR